MSDTSSDNAERAAFQFDLTEYNQNLRLNGHIHKRNVDEGMHKEITTMENVHPAFAYEQMYVVCEEHVALLRKENNGQEPIFTRANYNHEHNMTSFRFNLSEHVTGPCEAFCENIGVVGWTTLLINFLWGAFHTIWGVLWYGALLCGASEIRYFHRMAPDETYNYDPYPKVVVSKILVNKEECEVKETTQPPLYTTHGPYFVIAMATWVMSYPMLVYILTSMAFCYTMECVKHFFALERQLSSILKSTKKVGDPTQIETWGMQGSGGACLFWITILSLLRNTMPTCAPPWMSEVFVITTVLVRTTPDLVCDSVYWLCVVCTLVSFILITSCRFCQVWSSDPDGVRLTTYFFSYWMYTNTVIICSGMMTALVMFSLNITKTLSSIVVQSPSHWTRTTEMMRQQMKWIVIYGALVGVLNIYACFTIPKNADFIGKRSFGNAVIMNVCNKHDVHFMCMYKVEDCMQRIDDATTTVTPTTRDTYTSALESVQNAAWWFGNTTYLDYGHIMTESQARLVYIQAGYKVDPQVRKTLIELGCLKSQAMFSPMPLLLAYEDNTLVHYFRNAWIFNWGDFQGVMKGTQISTDMDQLSNFFKLVFRLN
jgi:hypothetical protein